MDHRAGYLCRRQADTVRRALSSNVRLLSILAAACLGLSACLPQTTGRPSLQSAVPQAAGATIGEGATKIALLVPLSGGPGTALRNAAELAFKDSSNTDLQILVRDTGGSAEGGQAAAQQVVAEGATLVIGPLFAQEVASAASVARAAGVPMIAFSTDPNVGARGVYLLSFLAESEVDHVVRHAVKAGRKSFAALVPSTNYGSLAEAAFQQAVSRYGGRIAAVERLTGDATQDREAAGRIARIATGGSAQVDTVFIPEGGQGLRSALDALQAAGLDTQRVRLIGTGVWNDAQTLADPRLQGGWFAGPSPDAFGWFAGRYREAYGTPPIRIASLAYDATRLAAELAKVGGYGDQVLVNPNGFAGVDGIFRFRPDGGNDRGLAILEVRGGSAVVVTPAPQTFQGQLAGQ